jgi:hypothetical protein
LRDLAPLWYQITAKTQKFRQSTKILYVFEGFSAFAVLKGLFNLQDGNPEAEDKRSEDRTGKDRKAQSHRYPGDV